MSDRARRYQLFHLLANLPPAQFEGLLFALNLPAGNVSASSAAQSYRVGELLQWAESPIGCGLPEVAIALKDMFGIDVPDFMPTEPPASMTQTPELKVEDAQPPEWKEHLGNGVYLEMVNIPAGRFWMGSPDSEAERSEDEGPVHSVTVPALAMGQYPVTQAEWSEVAALPKVNQDLKPFPSHFKGQRRPVEQVSWDEAVEFCDRLSRFAQRLYRLPSEAEWEYACRARTQTPFYFGETLSTDQANYDGRDTYGKGVKGEYRQQTTDVGSFPANGFGLYDLHGNVWEWCQDVWHSDYQGAPADGSVWMTGGDQQWRVQRGGWNCRSALRLWDTPANRAGGVGLRVVCAPFRT